MTILRTRPRRCSRPSLLAVSALVAGQTRTWSQGDYADFEKGIVKNLSLRSDGLLTLAPRSHGAVRHLAPPTCGRWRGIPRATCTPAAAPAPSSSAFRRTARASCSAELEACRSRPWPWIPRTACTPPPRPMARSIASRQRQAGSLLRSQDEIHLGAGVRRPGRPAGGHRRPRRDPPRDARRQRQGRSSRAMRHTCAP